MRKRFEHTQEQIIKKRIADVHKDMASRGRIGGLVLRATHSPFGPNGYTGKARRAFLGRFIPNDPELTERERNARAEAGLRAHMTRLARSSAQRRRRKRST